MQHISRLARRIGTACAIATLSSAGTAVGASAETAKTLHLFARALSSGVFQANGKPLGATAAPQPGDYLIGTDIDYLGDHKKHSKNPVGTDNAVCTFTTATTGICDEVIAVGGSLLLFDHVTVDFGMAKPVSRITGGTGKFKGARGRLIVTPGVDHTNNSNFSVRYAT